MFPKVKYLEIEMQLGTRVPNFQFRVFLSLHYLIFYKCYILACAYNSPPNMNSLIFVTENNNPKVNN